MFGINTMLLSSREPNASHSWLRWMTCQDPAGLWNAAFSESRFQPWGGRQSAVFSFIPAGDCPMLQYSYSMNVSDIMNDAQSRYRNSSLSLNTHTHIYICIKWIYRIYGIYKQMWIMSKKSRTIVISQIGTGMWTPETMHKLTDLISSERWWPLATPLSFTVGKVTVGVSHLCTKVIYIYSHMHKHVDVDVILHIHL
jgi:hypothetical protein